MRHCWFILGLLLLAAPLPVLAADMQAPAQPQSVEEPDASDDDPDAQMSPGTFAPVTPQTEAAPLANEKPPGTADTQGDASYDGVILRGLNKVTAHAQTIEATIGSVVRFGTMEIVAHRCWKSAPDERPENAALLEISEVKQGEAPTQIFLGWMFSSSPGLSALEHPFYDITVVKCEKAEAEKSPAQAPAAKKANAKVR
jgi:hypothetical protein